MSALFGLIHFDLSFCIKPVKLTPFFPFFVGGGHQDGGQEADERHRHGGQGQARGQTRNSISFVIQV
jgi:hypothetical protein